MAQGGNCVTFCPVVTNAAFAIWVLWILSGAWCSETRGLWKRSRTCGEPNQISEASCPEPITYVWTVVYWNGAGWAHALYLSFKNTECYLWLRVVESREWTNGINHGLIVVIREPRFSRSTRHKLFINEWTRHIQIKSFWGIEGIPYSHADFKGALTQ